MWTVVHLTGSGINYMISIYGIIGPRMIIIIKDENFLIRLRCIWSCMFLKGMPQFTLLISHCMIPCINDIFWILSKIAQCTYSLLTWSYHRCINLHLDKCNSLFWCNESEYQNKNYFTKSSYPDHHKHCKMFFEMHFCTFYFWGNLY